MRAKGIIAASGIAGLTSATLVHEIGHVLGNGHTSGTIMRADIMDFMKTAATKTAATRRAMATNVDWTDDLIEMGFNFDFQGAYEDASSCSCDDFYKQYFTELMGRAPVGKVSSHLWRKSDDFHLVIADGQGSHDFVLDLGHKSTAVVRQKTIFKIYDPNDFRYNRPQDAFPDVIIYFGQIKTASGKMADIMFQRGGGISDSWHVQYYGLKSGEWGIFSRLPGGIPFNSP